MGKGNESDSDLSGNESEHQNTGDENSGDEDGVDHSEHEDGNESEGGVDDQHMSEESNEMDVASASSEVPIAAVAPSKIPAKRGRKPKASKVSSEVDQPQVQDVVPAKRSRLKKPAVAPVVEPSEVKAPSGRGRKAVKDPEVPVTSQKPVSLKNKKKVDEKQESDDQNPVKKQKVVAKKNKKAEEPIEEGTNGAAKTEVVKRPRGRPRKVVNEQDPEEESESHGNLKQKATRKAKTVSKDASEEKPIIDKNKATEVKDENGSKKASKAVNKKSAKVEEQETSDPAPAKAKRSNAKKLKENSNSTEDSSNEPQPKKRGRPKKEQSETKVTQNRELKISIEHCNS